MISMLRCLYLVCWRNRLLIPLIISCASFAMVVTMFYHGSSEEPSVTDYMRRHKIQPREAQKMYHDHTAPAAAQALPLKARPDQAQPNIAPPKKVLPHLPDALALAASKNSHRVVVKDAARPTAAYEDRNILKPDAKELIDKLKSKLKKDKTSSMDLNVNEGKNAKDNIIVGQLAEHLRKEKSRKKPNDPISKGLIKPKSSEKHNFLVENRIADSKVNSILSDMKQQKSNNFFQVGQNENGSLDKKKRLTNMEETDKSIVSKLRLPDDYRSRAKYNKTSSNFKHIENVFTFKPHIVSLISKMDATPVVSKKLNSTFGYFDSNGQWHVMPNNRSFALNASLTLKPVKFRPDIMPTSSHKHKVKLVNYDVKPSESKVKFVPYHSKMLYRNSSSYLPEYLGDWLHDEEHYCKSHLVTYHGEFALLRDVVLDLNFAKGNRGGESIESVLNQPEEDEYYQYMYGFFQLPCKTKPDYFFNNNNHNNQWLFATRTVDAIRDPVDVVDNKFTIAVVRYEYVNIYHSMTDFYNAFLVMEFFNRTQSQTNILVIDGHPAGTLDGVWNTLFNSSQRVSDLPKRTKFTNLVWGMLGYNSPMMDHYAHSMPLASEFRKFFLSSYQIDESHKLSCDHLTITFIWRRDYVAHPRNPTGAVSRKIANEEELVLTLHDKYPNYTIQGMQIDLFDMHQQLQIITHTDILIGMHGAGLTHALFLPQHAGLVELLPVYWAAANEHFEAIARWRRLLYQRWINVDPQYEIRDHVTKIPPEVLSTMVTSIISDMCTGNTQRLYPGFGSY